MIQVLSKFMQFNIFVCAIKVRSAYTQFSTSDILFYYFLKIKTYNIPIFFTMHTESNSSQSFISIFWLLQLNERDAKEKNSDEIIRWLLHFFEYWHTYLNSNSQTFGMHYSLLYWMWHRNSFDHTLESSYTHHCYCMLLPIHHMVLLWCNMCIDYCRRIHYILVLNLFIV